MFDENGVLLSKRKEEEDFHVINDLFYLKKNDVELKKKRRGR